MANGTKIALSEEELRVVTDTNWILTKQAITVKIYELFNQQVLVIRQKLDQLPVGFPAELTFSLPKISRGENYKGFPYVMLDYPAVFQKQKIFALRTMLWWGNFISVTLLLTGEYKDTYGSVIGERCVQWPEDIYICVHDDPWEHHFEKSNYVQVNSLKKEVVEQLIQEKSFLKLAIKIELKFFNDDQVLEAAYAKIGGLFI
jgi:hypothetical protein